MSPPEKKKKKPSPILQSTQQPTSLPDDLLWNCFARTSRLYYPTLSLVSKTFRSLLTSPELYRIRSSLGRTESCLYVCLEFPPDPNPRWYTLCRKPHKTLESSFPTKKKKKEKEPSGYVLVQVPVLQSPNSFWSSLVSVGSNIYNIGGYINNKSSSSVYILDCRSHTWHEGPSLKEKRMSSCASVVDGKIYVGGGSDKGPLNVYESVEVFDPKTQMWDLVPPPGSGVNWRGIIRSACIDEKFCLMVGPKGLSYEAEEGKWELIKREMGSFDLHCEWAIGNVLYCYNEGEVRWYDTRLEEWRKLLGLEGLPKIAGYCRAKLADYGGKMVILWDKYVASSGYKNKMIWCAVITLEGRHIDDMWGNNNKEMWGKVEWCDSVLTVPKSYKLQYALAATL